MHVLPVICKCVAKHQCPASTVRLLVAVGLDRVDAVRLDPIDTRTCVWSFAFDFFTRLSSVLFRLACDRTKAKCFKVYNFFSMFYGLLFLMWKVRTLLLVSRGAIVGGKLPLIIANINHTHISPWFGYISREGGEGRGELIAKFAIHEF